jgi:hypothetical protein
VHPFPRVRDRRPRRKLGVEANHAVIDVSRGQDRPITLTKVLRGNPYQVTFDTGFSNAAPGRKDLWE